MAAHAVGIRAGDDERARGTGEQAAQVAGLVGAAERAGRREPQVVREAVTQRIGEPQQQLAHRVRVGQRAEALLEGIGHARRERPRDRAGGDDGVGDELGDQEVAGGRGRHLRRHVRQRPRAEARADVALDVACFEIRRHVEVQRLGVAQAAGQMRAAGHEQAAAARGHLPEQRRERFRLGGLFERVDHDHQPTLPAVQRAEQLGGVAGFELTQLADVSDEVDDGAALGVEGHVDHADGRDRRVRGGQPGHPFAVAAIAGGDHAREERGLPGSGPAGHDAQRRRLIAREPAGEVAQRAAPAREQPAGLAARNATGAEVPVRLRGPIELERCRQRRRHAPGSRAPRCGRAARTPPAPRCRGRG